MSTPVIETTSFIVFRDGEIGGQSQWTAPRLRHPTIPNAQRPVATLMAMHGGAGYRGIAE
jgi:hypothetical protein